MSRVLRLDSGLSQQRCRARLPRFYLYRIPFTEDAVSAWMHSRQSVPAKASTMGSR